MEHNAIATFIIILLLIFRLVLFIIHEKSKVNPFDPDKKPKLWSWWNIFFPDESAKIKSLYELLESGSTEPVPETQQLALITNLHGPVAKAFRNDNSTRMAAAIDDLLSDLRRKQKSADMDMLSPEIDKLESMKKAVMAQSDFLKVKVSEVTLGKTEYYESVTDLNEKIEKRVTAFNEALKMIHDTLSSMSEQMDAVIRSYDDLVVYREFGGGDADGFTALIEQIRGRVKETTDMVSSIVGGAKEVFQ